MPPLRFILCCVVLLLCGCMGQRNKLESPDWETQRSAVEKLVPVGTTRDDAATRLKEAGISFSPSGSETEYRPGMQASTFYCALWHRDDGNVWPLNVALWFDQEGILYGVHQADAEIAPPQGISAPNSPSTGSEPDSPPTVDQTPGSTSESPPDAASPRSGQFRPFNTR